MASEEQVGESLGDTLDVFLSRLIVALRKIRLEPTAEDVADIFWLAAYQRKPYRLPELDEKSPLALSQEEKSKEGTEQKEEPKSTVANEDREETQKQGDGEAPVYPRRLTGGGKTQSGTPIRIPGARALPGTIEITRALRPLMRRVPSRQARIFDETATARRIAEDGLWIPVFRPAPERWLSLDLLIDDCPSMRIWQRTVEELKTLLSGLGAFQDVRSWSFATGNSESVTISKASGLSGRSTQELLDSAGRRLLLIVTDCVAPAWRSVRMKELLEIWAISQPVALVQLLPRRLWSRTGLACASFARVRAPEPGVSSARLKMKTRLRQRQGETRLPIPITTLEPAFVASWARLVGGMAGQAPAAILYPEVMKAPSPQDRSTEVRLQAFRSSASPLAFRLACLLAAAPLSLPVMRMVQRVMLPHSRQSHLAEFFLSGLLRRCDDCVSGDGYAGIFYDFVPGIRDLLLDAGEIPDAVQVQRILSQHVESHYGQILDFQAVLNDPEGITLTSLDRMNPHFATISAMVLKRLGGIYARIAEQIVDSYSADANPTSSDTTTLSELVTRKTSRKETKKWVPRTPSSEEGAHQLERYLWSAADILRGSIETLDYISYIFPVLFLKRMSDRFDEECEALIDEGLDPEDRDEHQFFVPKRARWSRIMKTTENLGEVINKALSALGEENPGLEDVLAGVDFKDERLFGDSHQRDTTLRRLVQHFSKIDLKNSNLSEPDTLGRAYEYLIEKFAEDAGKKGGELYTPRMVARLIVEILEPEEGMRICDPVCGSGGMLIQSTEHLARQGKNPHNLSIFGQEKNLTTWAICRMNMLLHEQFDAQIEKGDMIRDPKLLQDGELMLFDRVLAHPPFSLDQWGHEAAETDAFGRFRFGIPPKTKGDLAFVQHMVATLNDHGKLGVVLPHGALFRGASEGRIRQGLIEEGLIEAVVGLPARLFYGTSIPASILVINRKKPDSRKGKVLFVEASREFREGRVRNALRNEDIEKIAGTIRAFQELKQYARIVDIEEIESNDFNLSVSCYIDMDSSRDHSIRILSPQSASAGTAVEGRDGPGSPTKLTDSGRARYTGFSSYFRMLGVDNKSSDEMFSELWTDLRKALTHEMKQRGLWLAPPRYLGVYGGSEWTDELLEELLTDCYIFFLSNLTSLRRQLEARKNIDGLIYLNIRHFLHETQKRCDPLSFRILEVVHEAVSDLLQKNILHVISAFPEIGNDSSLRIRNDTVLAFAPSHDPGEAGDVDLGRQAAAWNNVLLPELLISARVSDAAAGLADRIASLRSDGIEIFRFQDLIDPLKADARARWQVLMREDEGTSFDEDDKGVKSIVKMIWPENVFEERQSFEALIECVSGRIESAKLTERYRTWLMQLWTFMRFWAAEPESHFPSHRTICNLLAIPRERIATLLETLGSILEECRGDSGKIKR